MSRSGTRILSIVVLSLSLVLSGCGGGGGSDNAASANPPPPTQSNDASLSSISLSIGTLDPVFNSSTFSYVATVANAIDNVDVTVGTTHSGASYTINGASSGAISLSVGDNTITIVVTAENGTTQNTYTVTVAREAAQLASIDLSANTFLMIANGTSSPTLSKSFVDENSDPMDESTLTYELHANDVVQSTTQFTTMLAGDYALKVVSASVESNTVDVRAREQMSHATIEIPIIFHIVHFGEPIGVGPNISASAIEATLDNLNNAYSNQFGSTDPNAVDTQIRFRLATESPDALILPEAGINRFDGTPYDDGSPFNIETPGDQFLDVNEAYHLQGENFWDPRQYLNFWIIERRDDRGSAPLPRMLSSNPLPGLASNPTDYEPNPNDFGGLLLDPDRLIDGGPHEVGHALGLLHPWSDGVCGEGDHVDDTFNYLWDGSDYPACPNNLGIEEPTSFMDYRGTFDTFTYSQRERMRHALQHGIWIRDLPNSTK